MVKLSPELLETAAFSGSLCSEFQSAAERPKQEGDWAEYVRIFTAEDPSQELLWCLEDRGAEALGEL